MKRYPSLRFLLLLSASASYGLLPALATAQQPSSPQRIADQGGLAETSPFRNPNIIYLEANQIIDERDEGVLTAKGDVNARYQDRTLRADEIIYYMGEKRVIALGNVQLSDSNGAIQYADKIELTDQLRSGLAKDFYASFPQGGVASAAYAVRRPNGSLDLYSAYYSPCPVCEDQDQADYDPSRPQTWRVKAAQVTQDTEDQMIHYKDAVIEFKGIPIFYSPYLAHPDPSSERRSGLLVPEIGTSGKYGVYYNQPYYWSLSDYTGITLTPRIMTKVNPVIEALVEKRFYSGDLTLDTSLTYEDWFDGDGRTFTDADIFDDPREDMTGADWQGHIFAHGDFDITDHWDFGFGVEAVTDDLYLERYDIEGPDQTFGLYDAGAQRLINQAYLVGQGADYRYSLGGYELDSLRTTLERDETQNNLILIDRERDETLPQVLPKITLDHYMTEPLLGGRLHGFADITSIKRNRGVDYQRLSAGLDWSKNWIAPMGIEFRPFAMARIDDYALTLDDAGSTKREFTRQVGQTGLELRWPFIRPSAGITMTVEPRLLLTQSFGDSKSEEFSYVRQDGNTASARQDGLGLDLDRALLWQANKAGSYDLWDKGFRADIGANFTAQWDQSRASIFLGQSFADDMDDSYQSSSGLAGTSSDYVGEIDINLFGHLSSQTRFRFDDDNNDLRRIDSNFAYQGGRLSLVGRYYKLDDTAILIDGLENDIPPEELSAQISYRLADNWSFEYKGYRDMEDHITRREEIGIAYIDDCAQIDVFYEQDRRRGLSGGSSGLGFRINLLSFDVDN